MIAHLKELQKYETPSYSLTMLPIHTCIAAGGRADDAVPVAAAWRSLHIAAKLLDDVEDGDEVVIGGKIISPAVATNLATGFMSIADIALVENLVSASEAVISQIFVQEFNRIILQMCIGQHLDIAEKFNQTIEDYRRIMAAKSGSFFQLAAWAGARCATSDENILSLMESFGYSLGMMLQLNDDLQDFRQKGTSGDLASGQATFPAYYALSVASPPERERLRNLLQRAAGDLLAEQDARNLIRALGGEVYMMAEIMRYRRRATSALAEMGLRQPLRKELEKWLTRLSLNPSQVTVADYRQ